MMMMMTSMARFSLPHGMFVVERPLCSCKRSGFVGSWQNALASNRRIGLPKVESETVFCLSSCYFSCLDGRFRDGRSFVEDDSVKVAVDERVNERDTIEGAWKGSLDWLDRSCSEVDSVAYASLLRRCSNAMDLLMGKDIHCYMIESGHERERFLGNLLVEMYGKCGALEDATAVFTKMQQRNVFTWTIIISAYARHGQSANALRLFHQMRLEGVIPSKATFVSILSVCSREGFLAEGKRMHAHVVESGFESDVVVGTALVNMYSKCGNLEDARAVFARMYRRDVCSWTVMIAACAQYRRCKEAFQLFQKMQLEGVIPNRVTFVSLLSACTSQSDLAEGKRIHAQTVASGYQSDIFVATALVNLYGRCGSLKDAWMLFDKMSRRDVFAWNAIIGALARNGHGKAALQVFQQMQLEGVIPDRFTFISILSTCASQAALLQGKQIHQYIVASRLESDVAVGIALLIMYDKCGSLWDAQKLFDKMPLWNVACWNAMISVFSHHGHGKEALYLFQKMQQKGVIPDKGTFINILSACANETELSEGRQIHSCIVASGLVLDVALGAALVNMYGKCGNLEDAWKVFCRIPERDVISWNAMIVVCIQNCCYKEAWQLFQQMQLEGLIPDAITFISMLSVCASQASLPEGKQVHQCIVANGIEPDIIVGTALVNMYGKCGSLEDAWRSFDKMPQQNIVSWNAMITAFAQHGEDMKVLYLFQKMTLKGMIPDRATFVGILSSCANLAALAEGKLIHACVLCRGFESDVVVGNALVNMYGKCGNLEDARRIFDKMPKRDVVSWSAMIAAYARHCYDKEAWQLFQQMQLEGVIPNNAAIVSFLSVCASQGALAEGKQMHDVIMGSGFDLDVVIGNALINMYGKCGSLENAQRTFDQMPVRDAVSWSAMISACAQHGHDKNAMQLFQQMQVEGMIPGTVTFVSILSACSHSGQVDEGCDLFVSMNRDFGIKPTVEHYNCMIDLLGRAGQLDKGENLINRMPYEPTATVWVTLLGACRIHFDMERGKHTAEHAFELDPDNASLHVLLSNIFAAGGSWHDAAKVRKMMKHKGLKKQAGGSSIEINNWVHYFFVGDELH